MTVKNLPRCDADEEPDQRPGGLPGRLGRGEEEHRGLEALAPPGERGHEDDGERPHGDRLLQAAPQLGLSPAFT